MKQLSVLALLAMLISASAGCFRQENQVAVYSVPAMASPAAGTYLENHIKRIPGVKSTAIDIQARTLTVTYESSTIREMNIEEGIALAGFAVNGRPANPNAKLPEGL